MAIVNYVKRHDEIRKEAKLAWNWLRNLPEYKSDYKNRDKLKGPTLLAEGDKLREKYGFYPLINPKEEAPGQNAPIEFSADFSKLLEQNIFDSGVDFKNPSYLESDAYEYPEKYRKYNYKRRPLKGRILVEIDPKKPINFILEQIEWYLKRVKRIYKIKDSRPRPAELNLMYKAYVLLNLGIKQKIIMKEIALHIDDNTVGDSQRDKAKRILRKVKSIRAHKL